MILDRHIRHISEHRLYDRGPVTLVIYGETVTSDGARELLFHYASEGKP